MVVGGRVIMVKTLTICVRLSVWARNHTGVRLLPESQGLAHRKLLLF